MKSCTREVIAGGRVTIGLEQSVVDGGKVERTAGAPHWRAASSRPAEQASKSGGMVFRKPPSPSVAIDVMIYGLSPVVELAAGENSNDRSHRRDVPAPIAPTRERRRRRRAANFLDLERENKTRWRRAASIA